MNAEQLHFFIKEAFASIREINRRFDELKWVFRLESCNEETKAEIRERFKKLQETKFCLIYSIYDIRMQFCKTFEAHSKILGTIKLYEELRDL